MSTVRVARRRVHVGRGPITGIDGRGLVLAISLGAAIFACCFAIGRAANPGSGSRTAPAPSLPVAFTGTAISAGLSNAPTIELRTGEGARGRSHAQAGGQTVTVSAVRNARSSVPASIEGTPRGQGLGTEAPRASVPASPQSPAPTITSTPAPAAPATPTDAQGSGGSSPQTHSGSGGTSFDSSG